MSLRPIKDFHLSVFFKDGKPCMMIESINKNQNNISKLEALEKKVREWLQ